MKVDEQSLTSFSIELNNLARACAKLSKKEVSSNKLDLAHLSNCLNLAQITLEERLTSAEEDLKFGFGSTGK